MIKWPVASSMASIGYLAAGVVVLGLPAVPVRVSEAVHGVTGGGGTG